MSVKTCTKCKEPKALEQFARSYRATGERPARGGCGVGSQCKLCISELRKPGLAAERFGKAALAQRGLKTCAKCRVVKPFAEFHKRVASGDQLAHKCKSCVNHDSSAWRDLNPEAHGQWYEQNKDYKAEYFLRWRSEHIEAEKARIAKWAKDNPHKVNALGVKRHAAKLHATPTWANQGAVEAFYAEAARLTKATGIRHEVDHIVPLQGKIVRGLHWEGNLQVLPKTQNISKSNRRWPDMPC